MVECWICKSEGEGGLGKFCQCRGDLELSHKYCLMRWLETSGRTVCVVCGAPYRGRVRRSFVRGVKDNPMVAILLGSAIGGLLYCALLFCWDLMTLWSSCRDNPEPGKLRALAVSMALEATVLIQGWKNFRPFLRRCVTVLQAETMTDLEEIDAR